MFKRLTIALCILFGFPWFITYDQRNIAVVGYCKGCKDIVINEWSTLVPYGTTDKEADRLSVVEFEQEAWRKSGYCRKCRKWEVV